MKHKWIITPRGRRSKYYDCVRCKEHIVAFSKKGADSVSGECQEKERK